MSRLRDWAPICISACLEHHHRIAEAHAAAPHGDGLGQMAKVGNDRADKGVDECETPPRCAWHGLADERRWMYTAAGGDQRSRAPRNQMDHPVNAG
jgi:hypothetical protein